MLPFESTAAAATRSSAASAAREEAVAPIRRGPTPHEVWYNPGAMLAEIAHVLRHAPATLALKRRVPRDELYETLIGRADAAGLAARRADLVADLQGNVVEIGCGTGAMFSHYRSVTVTAIEPDTDFAARARIAARSVSNGPAPVAVEVVIGSGEALPLDDGSMDAAVLALVLCSVQNVDVACAEIARVVRPGGDVLLIEHVVSPHRIAGALMHAVNPLWLRINSQGCHLDRDPLPALERAGLRIGKIDPFQIWCAGIPPFPMRMIRAARV